MMTILSLHYRVSVGSYDTVDMVYTIDMVFTIDIVSTVDMVYAVDMVYNVTCGHGGLGCSGGRSGSTVGKTGLQAETPCGN